MRIQAALAAVLAVFASPACAGPRVLSLDQCADQFVLALSPRADVVGLSRRATNGDSYLARQAVGLPQRRATAEQILAARPTIVVRYWGGDDRLLNDLASRGVAVVRIDDATDFAGVRVNVRRVSAALGRREAGEQLIARLDRQLAASRGAWAGDGAFYLTSGGDTAGGGVLIDAILRGAGLTNLGGGTGYHAVPLERLTLDPPKAIVAGFFDGDAMAAQRWSIGRHAVVRRLIARSGLVSLRASILGCPAWFAGDAVAAIAARRPSEPAALITRPVHPFAVPPRKRTGKDHHADQSSPMPRMGEGDREAVVGVRAMRERCVGATDKHHAFCQAWGA